MKGKNSRAISNLKMLEKAAKKLGKLNEEVVYVGGCTTALIIDSPLTLDVRQKSFFMELLQNGQFQQSLPGHLTDGSATVTLQRVQQVMNRIKILISS